MTPGAFEPSASTTTSPAPYAGGVSAVPPESNPPQTDTVAGGAHAPGMPSPQGRLEQELRSKLTTARVLAVVFAVTTVLLGVLLVLQATVLRPSAPVAEKPSASETPAPAATPSLAEQVARNDKNDTMAFGELGAPVTIVEWIDYRCPFCAKYTNETFPTLMKEYVDTGLVRYEVHDMSMFGDDSTAAAVAGRAAAAQGRFGEYLTVLYAAAPASGHPDLPRETLIAFAHEAGVPDVAAFEKALDDPAGSQAVLADTETAKQMGVTSVPFFVIGDVTIPGAQELTVFRGAIDEALKTANSAR